MADRAAAAVAAATRCQVQCVATNLSQYQHAQHQMRFLVPALPVHSRIDDLDRVWQQEMQHEARRAAILTLVDYQERKRLAHLRETRAMVGVPCARETNRLMQASCSLSELTRPFGDRTAAIQLLNRRVDVNRHRKIRAALHMEHQRSSAADASAKQAVVEDAYRHIAEFEDQRWPSTKDLAGHTAHDWTCTRKAQKPCAARPQPKDIRPGALSDTQGSGCWPRSSTRLPAVNTKRIDDRGPSPEVARMSISRVSFKD